MIDATRGVVVAVYRKQRPGAPAGFFACEAAGLRWLAAAGGAPVVEVLGAGDDHLDLRRLEPVAPTREAARAFGAGLAVTHAAGAPAFGAGPPGWVGDGFFGPLDSPLTMPAGHFAQWGPFLAACRLAPLDCDLREVGIAMPGLAILSERLRTGHLDDDEPPARVHGDLWSGNVLWTADGATLIDPAAHGGHRESDLAMLALFGLAHLDDVLGAYDEVAPLRSGWRHRVALHQVYPLGVHALLFGGSYFHELADVVERAVRETTR
ncbi:fructosamine kinase family protein [Cellulomonas sp. PhB150]|uniref:fructosamine kinase family protein n=1 Tax=Cellulomonas sp. PhB150 TaxID=2485188 RepID=UPI000F9A243B|nr:fructosamine kinase family protein [Cellulomonas sp. PhB150]ROS30455.1 fructosamine-3-kinase [Cellulomonas sp. PhB150]